MSKQKDNDEDDKFIDAAAKVIVAGVALAIGSACLDLKRELKTLNTDADGIYGISYTEGGFDCNIWNWMCTYAKTRKDAEKILGYHYNRDVRYYGINNCVTMLNFYHTNSFGGPVNSTVRHPPSLTKEDTGSTEDKKLYYLRYNVNNDKNKFILVLASSQEEALEMIKDRIKNEGLTIENINDYIKQSNTIHYIIETRGWNPILR
jgi:hypothetical protein